MNIAEFQLLQDLTRRVEALEKLMASHQHHTNAVIGVSSGSAPITPPIGTRMESHRRFVPDYGSEGEY